MRAAGGDDQRQDCEEKCLRHEADDEHSQIRGAEKRTLAESAWRVVNAVKKNRRGATPRGLFFLGWGPRLWGGWVRGGSRTPPRDMKRAAEEMTIAAEGRREVRERMCTGGTSGGVGDSARWQTGLLHP